MTYGTPRALRVALEQRLLTRSNASGVGLDRLRRRVIFERIVARLQGAELGRPGVFTPIFMIMVSEGVATVKGAPELGEYGC